MSVFLGSLEFRCFLFLFFFLSFSLWNVHLNCVGSEDAPLRSVESRTTYDTMCQCPWYCCSIAMIRCKVPTKKGVPPDREGSLPTYGPNERRASYVNMGGKHISQGKHWITTKKAPEDIPELVCCGNWASSCLWSFPVSKGENNSCCKRRRKVSLWPP